MRIVRTQKPAGLAIGLEAVKTHLRLLGYDDENSLVASYVDSACEFIFQRTWKVIQSASYTAYLDDWNNYNGEYSYNHHYYRDYRNYKDDCDIKIKMHPVTSLDSIKYYDADGVQQTMVDGTDYFYSINGNFARIKFLEKPTLQDNRYDAIEIAFTAGYANQFDIPDDLIHCLKILVADAFNNRNSQTAGMSVNENKIPQSVDMILANNSLKDFG
jgi:uncharacterized phiE125 gp8 family phage protein